MELENETWPYSQKELEAARVILFHKISFLDIMKKLASRIEGCWHSDFTHRCCCPFHNGGQERTPSFYFSEKTKQFHCFACNFHGDAFDVLSVAEGRPSFWIVADFLANEEITQDAIDSEKEFVHTNNYDIVFLTNAELSAQFRDYLWSWKNHSNYESEKNWVDRMFIKIDDRFVDIEEVSGDQAKSFKIQNLMELSRRTASMKRKYKDWAPPSNKKEKL